MANEGRIYKVGSTYYVDKRVGGQRVRRAAGPTEVHAETILERLSSTGMPELTLRQMHRAHIASLRLRCKATSVSQAEVQASILEAYFGPNRVVQSLAPRDLDGFVEARLREVSAASVNGQLRHLRAAMNHALEHGAMRELPVRVKLLKTTRRIPRILGLVELDRLLGCADRPYDLILLLAAKAGLRHQEILHLQVGDIDFGAWEIHVSAKAGWSPKSHAERVVPFGSKLRLALQAHIGQLWNGALPEAWLFPGYEGRQRQSVTEPIRQAFRDAGLYKPSEKPGLHQLRRTWASSLLAKGADIETVRELGGWADLVTVQRYLSSSTDLKRRAIDSLD